MTELDVIDNLEERVKILEQKIYGENMVVNTDQKTIVDSLIQSQTYTSSALSGRDKFNLLVKRIDQLEAVSDPTYEDSIVDTVAKTEFVLAVESELEAVVAELTRMVELLPVFESEYIKNIPNLTSQVEKLALVALENQEKHELVTKEANKLVNKYTELTNDLTAIFAMLEKTVTELEIKSLPKKTED